MSTFNSTWVVRRRRTVAAAVLALTVTALATAGAVTPAAGAATPRQLVVKILSTRAYGKILVNVRGFALYTYSRDTRNHSNCNGQCLRIWPSLVLAKGIVPVGRDVRGLGVIVRSNGQRQVTFRGHPLYFFAGDTRPGQTKGQNVAHFTVAKLSGVTRSVTTTTAKGGYSY